MILIYAGVVTALIVFGLTIGFWNKSMTVTTVLMVLACLAGIVLAEGHSSDLVTVYTGGASAFVVYFCYMLARLVSTLNQIAVALQTRK
jgi:hypothetical protein